MLDKRNFYINGKWVKPSKSNDFEVIDPSTEEPFAIISLGSIEDTDKAISAAKNAFETWRESSKEKRLALLEKFDQEAKVNMKQMNNFSTILYSKFKSVLLT